MTTSAQVIALFLVLLSMRAAGAGDTLELDPGKWEIKSRVEMPMLEGAKEHTQVECMRDGSFDPQSLVEDDANCRITDQKRTGNTLRWTMVCASDAGEMRGSGEFTANGATANGSMQMSMDMAGRPITMRTSWKGRRLGNCD